MPVPHKHPQTAGERSYRALGADAAVSTPHQPLAVEPSDTDLIRAYAEGDPRAFEDLYRRHHTAVLRRLVRICGNVAVAEELAQEAFLRAAQRVGDMHGEIRFRAWVMRIGSNLGIDYVRALRRQPSQSFEDAVEIHPAPGVTLMADTEHAIEMREDRRFVASILARLNPRHRQVLMLREIEGLDYRSIAERMSISGSAVETLLFRARGRFRDEYAKAIAQV